MTSKQKKDLAGIAIILTGLGDTLKSKALELCIEVAGSAPTMAQTTLYVPAVAPAVRKGPATAGILDDVIAATLN